MTDKIISRRADGVGQIVFNNPEKRNAVSLEMWQAVDGVLEEVSDVQGHGPRLEHVLVFG